ncbi:hypothetical protein F25303_1794 [Fusarium sp. NRRL 25303]|nr:hypothetical protein F25303_1794 [Fusarium sp. NRRL 25303]
MYNPSTSSSQPTAYETPSESPTEGDPVSRGIIEESVAEELYIKFFTELLPQYPLILPDAPLSWRTLQQDRPALFRAVLATSSSCFRSDLWTPLFRDAERCVMEQAMIYGRKSLDLIQAALVLVTWSHPPDKFEHLNFSQFINIAAAMVIDLRCSNDERYEIPTSDPGALQQVPVIVFTRMMYAVVMIIKLEVLNRPTIDRKDVSEAEQISALDLISLVIEKLKLASDMGSFSVPATFHAVLGRLHSHCVDSYWCFVMGQNEINETVKPLMNLQVQDSSKEKEGTLPEVQQGPTTPQKQIFGVEYLSQQTEYGVSSDTSISLDDCFPNVAANAGLEAFWNNFFSEEISPTVAEQGFDMRPMYTE